MSHLFALKRRISFNPTDSSSRGRGYGGGGYSGGYYYRSPMIWDASDLLWFRSRRTPQKGRNAPMSFLESIFSFVFGDGDPNREFEEKRWQMVSRVCIA